MTEPDPDPHLASAAGPARLMQMDSPAVDPLLTGLTDWSAVLLAAGAGSRMRSRRPKILHAAAGRPLLSWVLEATVAAGIGRRVVVLSPATEGARALIGARAQIALQAEALGTADALRAAKDSCAGSSEILVLNADLPLIRPETLRALCRAHLESGAVVTFLTAEVSDPAGRGRVTRDAAGRPRAVVEERDATMEQRAGREINAGAYCFCPDWLWPNLARIRSSAASGELYLTDLITLAGANGARLATVRADEDEVHGVNSRAELAVVEAVARERVRRRLLARGVTLIDPATTYIDAGVQIGQDSVVQPNTCLWGETVIGEECTIGPNTIIRSSRIGDRCTVVASVIEEAEVEEDVTIGPFSHLRPGASIGRCVELGNFAEVKASRLGVGTRMHHVGYIGDAMVGEDVNIGAGTITCNFDGERKHRTTIGDSAFIGSDTMLVAPVSLGDRARTGAGSVVTRDVEADLLVAGVPARPLRSTRRTVEEDQQGP